MGKIAGKFMVWSLAAFLALGALDAQAARRLGGGGSSGRQSSNVTQREAAPPAPSQAQRAAPAPAATPAAAAPRSRWGGMLGGLAAGLGLAWLAHSLGLGGAMGSMVALMLVCLVGAMAIVYVMRARRAKEGTVLAAPGMSGLSQRLDAGGAWGGQERAAGQQRSGSMIGSGLGVAAGAGVASSWAVPEGFDQEGFLSAAKSNFVALQAAWDRSDTVGMRSMMTDQMLADMRSAMSSRDAEGAGSGSMRIEGLGAQLLGIESDGADYLASVEFEGSRVEGSGSPEVFREVWNMSKAKFGSSGWLLAGIQTMR